MNCCFSCNNMGEGWTSMDDDGHTFTGNVRCPKCGAWNDSDNAVRRSRDGGNYKTLQAEAQAGLSTEQLGLPVGVKPHRNSRYDPMPPLGVDCGDALVARGFREEDS